MTLQKSLLYGSTLALVLAIMYLFGVHTMIASASISVFSPSNCYTAAATSTLTYMTPGTATTTKSCALGLEGAHTAVVEVQVNASSTSSVFNTYIEESMDNLDWYPVQEATSSIPFVLTTRPYATFTFASSTIGGTASGVSSNRLGVSGTDNRNHYTLNVPVRMKYVRVFTALGLGGTNGGVWMQIIPRQDIN